MVEHNQDIGKNYLLDTRTCRDRDVERILFAVSTYSSQVYVIWQISRRLCTFGPPKTIYASLFVESTIFDSVPRDYLRNILIRISKAR